MTGNGFSRPLFECEPSSGVSIGDTELGPRSLCTCGGGRGRGQVGGGVGGGASEFARRGGGEGRGEVDCWIPLYSWGCWILSSTVGRWFCPDPRFGLTTTVSGDLEG